MKGRGKARELPHLLVKRRQPATSGIASRLTATEIKHNGTPRPWHVLLALTLEEFTFESGALKASEGEHKAPEFLLLGSRGTVPVVVDAATTIRDAVAALSWLDRPRPEPPLYGCTAIDVALVWQT